MSLKEYVFYTVMSLDAKRSVEDRGYYEPLSHGYAGAYISLRVSRDAAVIRAEQFFDAHIDPASYAMLEITFTTHGAAHYCMQGAGVEYNHASILDRQTYGKKDQTNYDAWHFNGKLYLTAEDDAGNVLMSSKWVDFP